MYCPLLQAVASPRLHKSCSQSGTGGYTRNGSHDLKHLIFTLNLVRLKAVFPASFLNNLCTVLTGYSMCLRYLLIHLSVSTTFLPSGSISLFFISAINSKIQQPQLHPYGTPSVTASFIHKNLSTARKDSACLL